MSIFANEWVAAWNSHDLDTIMEHYAEDIVFYSPFIKKVNDEVTGRITGKRALREYFSRALSVYTDLHFELYHVLEGVDSLVLYYKSVGNRLAAEMMVLNEDEKIIEVRAHYKEQ
jgi:ketosteroid isomerase-like protein